MHPAIRISVIFEETVMAIIWGPLSSWGPFTHVYHAYWLVCSYMCDVFCLKVLRCIRCMDESVR